MTAPSSQATPTPRPGAAERLARWREAEQGATEGPWRVRENGVSLADLYNADKRVRNLTVARLASEHRVPHPLNNVQYADGISRCRHSKRHERFDLCRQEVRS